MYQETADEIIKKELFAHWREVDLVKESDKILNTLEEMNLKGVIFTNGPIREQFSKFNLQMRLEFGDLEAFRHWPSKVQNGIDLIFYCQALIFRQDPEKEFEIESE